MNKRREIAAEYLSANEIEKIYGISRYTLRNWRQERRGPDYVRLGHKKILYRRDLFDSFMEQHSVTV